MSALFICAEVSVGTFPRRSDKWYVDHSAFAVILNPLSI